MADVLKIVLLILGGMLVFQAHWIASYALFPKQIERCSELYGRPVKLTGIGLLVSGPIILLGIFLAQKSGNNPAVQLIALVLIGVPVFLALFGSAGLAHRIGAGMASAADESAPWRRTMRGGVVLTLCYLLPFAGWFFLIGWSLITGAGAAVIVLFRKSEAPGAEVSPPFEGTPTEIPQKMS
jgi:hypothetical protein